jgi:hypothetical protein
MMYRESIPLAASPMDTESSGPGNGRQRRSIAKKMKNLCSNSGRCGGPRSNVRRAGPHTNKKTIKVGGSLLKGR